MRFSNRCAFGLVLGMVVHVADAYGQVASTAVAPDQTAPEPASDDIVVTATRRAASLQTVPIAVTALRGEELASAGATTTTDLTQVVPSLVMTSTNFTALPALRGVSGSASDPGNESPVAFYVDGVYQPESTANVADLLDIERIEVLRGPQGTLYGRNATGGLINIITRDPLFTPEGKASLSYGSFGSRSATLFGTTGLTEDIAASATIQYRANNGWFRDLVRGGHTGDRDNTTVRGKLLYTPSDAFKLVASVTYNNDNDPENGEVPRPLNNNTVGYSIANDPTRSRPRTTGPWQYAGDVIPRNKKESVSTALQASYDVGPVRLESTTAYMRNHVLQNVDTDTTTSTFRNLEVKRRDEWYSQEFRLLSDNSGSPFEWIAGVFLIHGNAFHGVRGLTPTVFSPIASDTDTDSWAVFAEGSYAITGKLKATVGGRYTWEKRGWDLTFAGTDRGRVEKTYDNFSPRFTLSYEPTSDLLAYATYSKGFKSGVFSALSTNRTPVNPELLTDYEIGIKSQPLSWLRANLAAFHYVYDDLQLSAKDTNGVTRLLNAASTTIDGLEAELSGSLSADLKWRLSGSLMDAKYDRFPNAPTFTPIAPLGNGLGNAITFIDAAGKHLNRAPDNTVNAALIYNHKFSGGTLGASVNVYHSASVYYDFSNRIYQPAYERINGEISWSIDDRYRVAVSVTNLTNEAIIGSISTSALSDYLLYAPPRIVSVGLSANF